MAEKTTQSNLNTLESVLFFFNEPVSFKKLGKILELDPTTIKDLSLNLEQHYLNRGIRVLITHDEVQMVATINDDNILEKLDQSRENQILTPASLETLATILYLDQATEDTIDAIRGVRSGRTIKKLQRRGYLEKNPDGSYRLSSEAIKQLGVTNLNDIPNASSIKLKLKALAANND